MWFRLNDDVASLPQFERSPDLRVWLYLVAAAKRSEGTARTTLGQLSTACEFWQGRQRIKPSRKSIRAALRRLQSAQVLEVLIQGSHEGTRDPQSLAEVRAQGYFVVSICDWVACHGVKRSEGAPRAGDGRDDGTLEGTPLSRTRRKT